jgi:hypothetical protein
MVLAMRALTDHIDGILHEQTQVRSDAIDLTVTECYDLTGPGRIDFGGGELEPGDTRPHERVYRNEDDDYQWWHLDPGQYLLEYNETLSTDRRLLVQPRDELLERGCSHPTLHVSELPRVPLSVGDGGLWLKENARVSTAVADA